jgi:hypothetical protein
MRQTKGMNFTLNIVDYSKLKQLIEHMILFSLDRKDL